MWIVYEFAHYLKKDPVLKVNFEAEESDIVKLYTPPAMLPIFSVVVGNHRIKLIGGPRAKSTLVSGIQTPTSKSVTFVHRYQTKASFWSE